MSEWHPIETAPKTGEKFLAACYGKTVICRWGTGPYDRSAKKYTHSWNVGADRNAQPTHWMPLPPPPNPNTTEQKGE